MTTVYVVTSGDFYDWCYPVAVVTSLDAAKAAADQADPLPADWRWEEWREDDSSDSRVAVRCALRPLNQWEQPDGPDDRERVTNGQQEITRLELRSEA